MSNETRRYKVIDLFCGCGGFSKGFQQADFDVLLGLDAWADAVQTYEYNFRQAVALHADICDIDAAGILKHLGPDGQDIDVVVGGPPCQGFSVSGKRLIDDPRNRLYKSFVELVGGIRPRVFAMENVPGIVRLFNGQVRDEIMRDFEELGYRVSMRLLPSDNFGVPQKRQRVFFVGVCGDKITKTLKFTFPEVTHGEGLGLEPLQTCKDAISDLDFIGDDTVISEEGHYLLPPETGYQHKMRAGCNILYNHVATVHTAKTRSIINLVPDGGNYKDLPIDLQATRRVNIAWTRMNSNKPCFTIDTGHNHHFHYRANRVPTARESARIQSFPDNFRFLGIKTSQLKQIGNAVPPLLAQRLAEQIRLILDRG